MITAEQREERRKWVGASDVAAILGLDEFRTANDIWASKVHELDDLKKSAAGYGDDLEPIALDRAERLFGELLYRFDTMHVPDTHLAANPDAVAQRRWPVHTRAGQEHRNYRSAVGPMGRAVD